MRPFGQRPSRALHSRLTLHLRHKALYPRARKTHALLNTCTFIHNLFSAGGLILGTTEKCDRGPVCDRRPNTSATQGPPIQKGRSNTDYGTRTRAIGAVCELIASCVPAICQRPKPSCRDHEKRCGARVAQRAPHSPHSDDAAVSARSAPCRASGSRRSSSASRARISGHAEVAALSAQTASSTSSWGWSASEPTADQ